MTTITEMTMGTPLTYLESDDYPQPPEYHPAACIFPLMLDGEVTQLAKSMELHGVEHSIVLLDGMVLDGRNRLRALQLLRADWREHVMQVDDWFEESQTDPVDYVLSLNLHRRHLTESQRAVVAARAANMKLGDNQYTKEGVSIDTPSREQAADQLKVSPSSVSRAKVVLAKGTPDLIDAVERGKVSVHAASRVAKLPEPEQRELVKQGPEAIRKVSGDAQAAEVKTSLEDSKLVLANAIRKLVAAHKPVMVLRALWDAVDVSAHESLKMFLTDWLEMEKKEIAKANGTAAKVVLTFPCKREKDGPARWELTQEKVDEYEQVFTGIDVVAELRIARQWLIDNPVQQKTYGGMPRFLTSWLTRSNNRGTAVRKAFNGHHHDDLEDPVTRHNRLVAERFISRMEADDVAG